MDKILRQMLIEGFRQVLNEEEEEKMQYIKKSKTFTKYAKKNSEYDKDFFNVEQIVSNLVSGTELDKDVSEDFSDFLLIRQTIGLSDVDRFDNSDEILEVFRQTFMHKDDGNDSCTDIGHVSTRFFIQTAFSKLLHSFNDQAAGFVGERLTAGLLGGSTIPAGSADIADIKVGETGISLKIKKEGIDGSIMKLCDTFGIYYKDHNNKFQKPEQKHKNLFYLIGRKSESGDGRKKVPLLKFFCFEVSKQAIIDIIATSGAETINNSNKSYFDLSTKNIRDKIEKKTFLNAGNYENLGNSGLENGVVENSVKYTEYDLNYSIDSVNKTRAELGASLSDTLFGMNNFLSDIREKLMIYSLNPTEANLTNLISVLQKVNNFNTAVLSNC